MINQTPDSTSQSRQLKDGLKLKPLEQRLDVQSLEDQVPLAYEIIDIYKSSDRTQRETLRKNARDAVLIGQLYSIVATGIDASGPKFDHLNIYPEQDQFLSPAQAIDQKKKGQLYLLQIANEPVLDALKPNQNDLYILALKERVEYLKLLTPLLDYGYVIEESGRQSVVDAIGKEVFELVELKEYLEFDPELTPEDTAPILKDIVIQLNKVFPRLNISPNSLSLLQNIYQDLSDLLRAEDKAVLEELQEFITDANAKLDHDALESNSSLVSEIVESNRIVQSLPDQDHKYGVDIEYDHTEESLVAASNRINLRIKELYEVGEADEDLIDELFQILDKIDLELNNLSNPPITKVEIPNQKNEDEDEKKKQNRILEIKKKMKELKQQYGSFKDKITAIEELRKKSKRNITLYRNRLKKLYEELEKTNSIKLRGGLIDESLDSKIQSAQIGLRQAEGDDMLYQSRLDNIEKQKQLIKSEFDDLKNEKSIIENGYVPTVTEIKARELSEFIYLDLSHLVQKQKEALAKKLTRREAEELNEVFESPDKPQSIKNNEQVDFEIKEALHRIKDLEDLIGKTVNYTEFLEVITEYKKLQPYFDLLESRGYLKPADELGRLQTAITRLIETYENQRNKILFKTGIGFGTIPHEMSVYRFLDLVKQNPNAAKRHQKVEDSAVENKGNRSENDAALLLATLPEVRFAIVPPHLSYYDNQSGLDRDYPEYSNQHIPHIDVMFADCDLVKLEEFLTVNSSRDYAFLGIENLKNQTTNEKAYILAKIIDRAILSYTTMEQSKITKSAEIRTGYFDQSGHKNITEMPKVSTLDISQDQLKPNEVTPLTELIEILVQRGIYRIRLAQVKSSIEPKLDGSKSQSLKELQSRYEAVLAVEVQSGISPLQSSILSKSAGYSLICGYTDPIEEKKIITRLLS
ncbi:MAG: hypothetical protein ACRCXZ_05645 [Patescibacteria group bacterium]